jgi:plastocyanin
MNESFRRRVFTPLLMPLTIVGLILLFGISVSRVLLAVPESMSVIIATVLAAYVLLMAFVVERNRGIAAPALAVGLVVGLLGVTGAGALAASAGIREIHHEEEGEGGEGGEGAAVAEVPADAVVWTTESTNIEYTDAPASFPAGEVTIAIDNPTGVPHNVVLEGFQDDAAIVEATSGIDVATLEVPAGTYTYYCSITGHRAAGMEGEVTVE